MAGRPAVLLCLRQQRAGGAALLLRRGEEARRVDLCDACRHYIKTIDCRSLEEPDPCLEDLATLHLDVVAVQKGYNRTVANPWTDR